MVWQDSYPVGPEDVISIHLECTKCGSSITLPFGENEHIPEACIYCHQNWFGVGSSDLHSLTSLIKSLKGLKSRSKGAACKIGLVVPGHLNMPDNSK